MESLKDFMRTIKGVISVEGTKDRVICALLSSGMFSCKSFRKSIERVSMVSDRWKLLCVMQVPLKFKCFAWLLLQGRIVARDRLQRLGVMQD